MERANYCFVCGKDNPKSLHLNFDYIDNQTVIAEFSLEKEYEGYPDTLHGGILAAILDDAMANTVKLEGILIYTIELNIKYLRPSFVKEKLEVKGWVEAINHRIIDTKGEIKNLSGELKVLASGRYFVKNRT
jgi:uncharacterized protein (TIGR00369 family)